MQRIMVAATWIVLLTAFCVHYTDALRCVRCEDDPDVCQYIPGRLGNPRVEDCAQFGDDQVCKSFFYYSQGKPFVEKGCYQRDACQTQAVRPDNQCGEFDGKDKPCRCCCKKDHCNDPLKGCIKPSKCGFPKKPRIGRFICPKKTVKGSVCTFVCPAGYDRMGSETTTCVQGTLRLTWTPLNQRCSNIKCPPLPPLENGEKSCVNKGIYVDRPDFVYVGTECTFKCDEGYRLVGSRRTQCKSNEKWSKQMPKCEEEVCQPFPKDPNRIDKCTQGNRLGSVCTFTCKGGQKVLGNNNTKCVQDPKDKKTNEWDKVPGRCVQVKCLPKQVDPTHGSVSCTNENFENSVCTFTCDAGYDLDDTAALTTTTKCLDDNDGDALGEWTDSPPTCSKKICQPRLTDPDGGTVSCNSGNSLGSVCTFKCDYGYDLVDTTRTTLRSTCEDDGNGDKFGKWSLFPPPTCTIITCEPPHKNPENGKVSCSDSNLLGSVCKFQCNEGYDMDGTDNEVVRSECEDDGDGDDRGEWSREAPTCSKIKCRPIETVTNGNVECSDENNLDSECKFECKYGYKRVGAISIKCGDRKRDMDSIAEWSDNEPKCLPIFCDAQKHDDTVQRSCSPEGTDAFEVDTVCTYTCVSSEDHYMVSYERPTVPIRSGSSDVTCLETGEWDIGPPSCKPVTCEPLKKPDNGHRPKCTNSNWLGSECTFVCLPTFGLTHSETPKCEGDGTPADRKGKWSTEPPKCEKIECEEYGQIRNGKISYSDGLKIGSVLTLTCNDDYTYKQYETAECLPAGNGQDVPYWSRRRNVCCVTCIFNTRLRVVSVVDKTIAQNNKDWQEVVTWHYYLLDFLYTKGYEVKFGLVLYDDNVDEANSLAERSLESLDDVEDVQYDMYEFPFGGKSSDTSGALEYAKTTYFGRYTSSRTSRRPKEEPYILVIKRPGSAPGASEAAKDIMSSKIHVMAMGFKRDNWKIEERNLMTITKDAERVLMVGGIADVTKAGEVVTKISKDQGCSTSSRNQPCS